jgi:hypothetical protein
VVVPASTDRTHILRLYMSAWNHNVAQPKPLGKPSKEKALMEESWWDSTGRLSCTCDRGRLALDAPCAHKLMMASLCGESIASRVLPTAQELGKGANVECLASGSIGSFFAVDNNPRGASLSPERRMLTCSREGPWYCEGRKDGCPTQIDCLHIRMAKVAVARADIEKAEGLLFDPEALGKASQWLGQWAEGSLPLLGSDQGVPTQRAKMLRESEGSSEENKHLFGLIVGQKHPATGCPGDSCFCNKHQTVFKEAHPPSDGALGSDDCGGVSASTAEIVTLPLSRSKQYWKAQPSRARQPVFATIEEPPLDARATQAIRCWVSACSSCTLQLAEARGGCPHEAHGRVEVPVMLEGTEAIQVTRPKMGQLSDQGKYHDPWVRRLKGGPIRASKLRDCHFGELSELGMLGAPCPLSRPPCGTEWEEICQDAVVSATTWSVCVRVRHFACSCPRKHAIHFDGEHLGLYCWTRGTILVQESLQLLLKEMQKTGSAFGALLKSHQSLFERDPDATVLSEETWRKASLDYFKLAGRAILECCSICGPHPEVR